MKAKRRKILNFIRVLSVECYKHGEGGQMLKKRVLFMVIKMGNVLSQS